MILKSKSGAGIYRRTELWRMRRLFQA